MRQLRVECYKGFTPYGPMHALQVLRQAEIQAGKQDDTLFLLEHQPVVTIGRNGNLAHLRAQPAELAAAGAQVFQVGRGGDITYHGPGQLVGYLLLQLQEEEQDLPAYVSRIEQLLIATVAQLGVRAYPTPGKRGIWCGRGKLAAIGVRIARWVTMHGFALNLAADLPGFGWMVPCGLEGFGVTSLAEQRGTGVERAQVEQVLLHHVPTYLSRTPYHAPATALPTTACEQLTPLVDWSVATVARAPVEEEAR